MDIFISHASEDNVVARPLAVALARRGAQVWFDEFSIAVGDSIAKSIDEGLRTCRYGVVVLSPHFFAKRWTRRELEALLSLEVSRGDKAILPIVHNLSIEELRDYSPLLADRLALPSTLAADRLAERILLAISGQQGRRVPILSGFGSVGRRFCRVTSPMVGKFLSRQPITFLPAFDGEDFDFEAYGVDPDAEPLVRPGERVDATREIFLIWAMGIAMGIQASVDGRFVRYLVGEGEPVAYGQPIAEIEL
jgi:biotin carboxyl carrier protein